MNFATKNMARVAVIAMIIAAASSMALAQVKDSGAQAITLNATLNESLTLGLSGNSVNFALTSGSATNAGSTNITATTSWVLASGRTAVGVYAYFTDAAAALSAGGSNNIPSSAFHIADNGGASLPLINTVAYGAGNAGLQLANVAITSANFASTRNDVMAFNIDLSSLAQLPAANYTGTLNIQAQATP
jgi:hypothetical protein